MPSRRAVLALTGVAAASGCLFACSWGYRVSATPATELEFTVEEPIGADRDLVERMLDAGHIEIAVVHVGGLFRNGELFEYDGVYYAVRQSEVTRRQVPAVRVDARYHEDRTPPADAIVFAFDDLPAADRRAMEYLVVAPSRRVTDQQPARTPGPYPELPVETSSMPYWNGAGESRLVAAGEAWVEWDDHTYHVDVLGEDTLTQVTHRYELDRLGTTQRALRDERLPADPVSLDDRPDVRAIVEDALDHQYETCESDPPELQTLRNLLRDQSEGDGHRRHNPYIVYDGTVYRVRVQAYEF